MTFHCGVLRTSRTSTVVPPGATCPSTPCTHWRQATSTLADPPGSRRTGRRSPRPMRRPRSRPTSVHDRANPGPVPARPGAHEPRPTLPRPGCTPGPLGPPGRLPASLAVERRWGSAPTRVAPGGTPPTSWPMSVQRWARRRFFRTWSKPGRHSNRSHYRQTRFSWEPAKEGSRCRRPARSPRQSAGPPVDRCGVGSPSPDGSSVTSEAPVHRQSTRFPAYRQPGAPRPLRFQARRSAAAFSLGQLQAPARPRRPSLASKGRRRSYHRGRAAAPWRRTRRKRGPAHSERGDPHPRLSMALALGESRARARVNCGVAVMPR